MPPRISASEWEIMNVLWTRGPLTAPEVMAALPPGTEWAQKTVNTFLARLVEKGAVSATRQGKANLYRPELTREDCVASEGDSFLERVFRGAAGDLVLHFCERADLSPDEIRELEALLKAKKGRR
ncbi:MAG: BlaI/MecI/CopY family transcriptional regulator [Opitutaceae bacterium]